MNKSKGSLFATDMAITSKHKACSTPERHQLESPSRDNDSLCDSDGASPVPFFCTQDGVEGETDVVWNYYTPKSDQLPKSRVRNSTPLSRKQKKHLKPKIVETSSKLRAPRETQRNTQLFQDLLELNQNIHQFISKKTAINNGSPVKSHSGSEDDILSDTSDFSPKSGLRTNSRCLRKNLLSSKFNKPECDPALELDDSLNDSLIIASLIAEEKTHQCEPTPAKKICNEKKQTNSVCKLKIDHDSMDEILNSIMFDSPVINKAKQSGLKHLEDDSFDNLVGNLNDSIVDKLTQVPSNKCTANMSTNCTNNSEWMVRELKDREGSPSSKLFGRHSSMPESPAVTHLVRPSTSGMVFGRHNSFPYSPNKSSDDTSPIRCTPDEIKRKHQQAKEKLLAKRLLPFTLSTEIRQDTQKTTIQQSQPLKRTQFQPRVASSTAKVPITRVNSMPVSNIKVVHSDHVDSIKHVADDRNVDVKLLIEKKRQEALMKLRKRQQYKIT